VNKTKHNHQDILSLSKSETGYGYGLFSKEIGLIDDSVNCFEDFMVVGVFPETDK
jgi:hypothetical protein